jgi:hypothetical protein
MHLKILVRHCELNSDTRNKFSTLFLLLYLDTKYTRNEGGQRRFPTLKGKIQIKKCIQTITARECRVSVSISRR